MLVCGSQHTQHAVFCAALCALWCSVLFRELFNNVACEAYFSDAGALQLQIDQQALLGVFRHYTQKPGSYFRELGDAIRLLNLPRETAEFLRQVSTPPSAPD